MSKAKTKTSKKVKTNVVKEHVVTKTLTEIVMIPQHGLRKESREFRQTKKKLKQDGHQECWVCKKMEDLDVHHFCCEWSLQKNVDFDKLKETCEIFDIYGYAKQMIDIPMRSVDDIRNAMVLCREHHMDYADGSKNGIHDVSFPVWISQKVCKEGLDPMPDNLEEVIIAKELAKDDKEDF